MKSNSPCCYIGLVVVIVVVGKNGALNVKCSCLCYSADLIVFVQNPNSFVSGYMFLSALGVTDIGRDVTSRESGGPVLWER